MVTVWFWDGATVPGMQDLETAHVVPTGEKADEVMRAAAERMKVDGRGRYVEKTEQPPELLEVSGRCPDCGRLVAFCRFGECVEVNG